MNRQFAVVHPDAGLEAPMHWLQDQKNQWRALNILQSEQIDLEAVHQVAVKEPCPIRNTGDEYHQERRNVLSLETCHGLF